MNYNNRFCLLALLGCSMLFVFSGCGGEPSEATAEEGSVEDTFQTYTLDIDKSDIPIAEVIDEVELMYLKETEESLLSYAYRISTVGDKLIFPGGTKGDVYIYTTSGEFINRFNRNGDGPGEYTAIQSTWVNGDSIMIYDNLKQVLHWYDYSGNELKNLSFPHRPSHIYPYKNGYVLDMTFSRINDSLRYRLLTVDSDLASRDMLLPYEKEIPFPISTTVNSFQKVQGKLIYKSVFADTTYLLDGEGVRPYYSIDFGDKFLWNDESMYENGQAAMKAIPESGKVWVFNASVGPEHIYLLYNTSFRDFAYMLVDRRTGSYRKLDMARNVEESYSLSPISWQGDWLLCSISSSDIESFLGELSEEQWTMRDGTSLEKIESSENPVLMWVKFKELSEQ
ncbi:MAG: 6-bladed beta-propeller [Roseivirga sp.]|nr:6-bladed beta-propeller [Roseivirga sp.]